MVGDWCLHLDCYLIHLLIIRFLNGFKLVGSADFLFLSFGLRKGFGVIHSMPLFGFFSCLILVFLCFILIPDGFMEFLLDSGFFALKEFFQRAETD